MITLTLTSCKRPDLFIRTIESLKQNCLDQDLITKILWADDHTNESDFVSMRQCLFDNFDNLAPIKYNHRIDGSRGLANSLNWLLANRENNFFLHVEDDWDFILKGKFISESLSVIKDNPKVKQVLLKERSMFRRYSTEDGVQYTLWEKGEALDGQIVQSSGFTLNPTITDVGFYHNRYGYFNTHSVEGSWDKSYDDGFRTACLTNTYIEHIGLGPSSFCLNGTPR